MTDLLDAWRHLDGTICVAGWDTETGLCTEGHGPVIHQAAWAEIDRLRVMLADCRTHRDRAEKSETRLLGLLEQVRVLVRRDSHED